MINLTAATKESIKKSLKSGYDYQLKAGEAHEMTLSSLHASKVPWAEVTSTVISCFKDWPLNDKGKPKGYQAAMKEDDFLGAHQLNRFNAYRQGKYTDYGVEKQKPEPKTPAQVKKDGESKSSEAHVVTSEEFDTAIALIGIFGLAEVQAKPELVACCETLAEALGIKLPEAPAKAA